MALSRSAWTMVALYVCAVAAFIYGYEHRPDADLARELGVDEGLVLAGAALLHVALGAVVRNWRAFLVLLVPVLVAIPAGGYPGGWPEVPVAFAVGLQLLVFGAPLVALGVLLGWIARRISRAPNSRTSS